MKIGFFEEEGVDVGVMNSILMCITFFALFVAPSSPSTSSARPSMKLSPRTSRRYVWPKITACAWTVVRKLMVCLDSQTKYAY